MQQVKTAKRAADKQINIADVVKRDGTKERYDKDKIALAVKRCFLDPEVDESEAVADELSQQIANAVTNILNHATEPPTIEYIQRLVIQQLWALNQFAAAEHYHNYREAHKRFRSQKPLPASFVEAVATDHKHFPSDLQYYQFISKFSRWREQDKRRETWRETCDRVMGWFKRLPAVRGKLEENEWAELDAALYNLQAAPAMRVIQMAGPALDRCHVGVYNCAYAPIDDLFSFPEALYVLMQGTGMGFSVESDYVNELPRIKKQKNKKPDTIAVPDSTEGWCDAYFRGLQAWFDGYDVNFDVSGLRPAGARLKTKGGRSSGPGPFMELMMFARNLILSRQGRYLEDIDCHGLTCMTGKIVQVGGVRRASLISLSDLTSMAMRNAKAGNWYESNRHFTMANNSAVYDFGGKLPSEVFMEEWLALVKSKSGERGIFNRAAALANLPRRRKKAKFGCNPCVTADTWVHTEEGPKQVSQLIERPFRAIVNQEYFNSTGFVCTGVKPVFKLKLKNGMELKLTDNHEILVNSDKGQLWTALDDLEPGDKVVIHNHRDTSWMTPGSDDFERGWLLGNLIGDGNITKDGTANLDYWGETCQELRKTAVESIHRTVGARADLKGCLVADNKVRVQSKELGNLAERYGLHNASKTITTAIEQSSKDFHRGFLCGYFDADGSVQGNQSTGVSIRLSSVSMVNLKAVQRMLLRLGIVSTIYNNWREAGYRELPDGRGDSKTYYCQTLHELVIARDNIEVFYERIGFNDSRKAATLQTALSEYRRNLNKESFNSAVESIVYIGDELVFDCGVEEANAFDANGLYVHNCAEIILRPHEFCNLSIAIARPDDTAETLKRKVRIATIFGLIQSTCTNFNYIRDEWKKNCEEERLLGVDITGHADCPLLRYGAEGRAELLEELKKVVHETKLQFSPRFGINSSVADTCVKPAGDSAVFFGCASGISAYFSQFQVRNVREPGYSPVAQFLKDSGVSWVPAPEDPTLCVFSFPKRAPTGATLRNDLTAIDQLENWLEWKKHWAEHSVSATIYVDEHEWPAVGAWVYDHFDQITGLSFLPKDNGIYLSAPNVELTEDQYNEAIAKFPDLNWAKLMHYELEDMTEVAQSYACVSGVCSI